MDTTAIILSISLLLLTLALSFLFSGSEIAFLSANRLKIELKNRKGNDAAQLLSKLKTKTSEIIITILIGNNLALVVFTTEWEKLSAFLLEGYFHLPAADNGFLYLFVQTIVATLFILILAEYIPKALFLKNSDRVVLPLSYVLNILYKVLYVPVMVINFISKVLLRYVFRIKTDEKIVAVGKQDLDLYIQEVLDSSKDSPVPDLDTDMLTNALALKETKVREFMIPRTDIIAIPLETTVAEAITHFIDTRLSKLVVYGENLDEIKGFIHSSSIFQTPESLEKMVQPVLVVPESMPASVLLEEFSEHKRSIAIVVGEFGGTSGMVTIEDLVEEVFGEIEDEHDVEEDEEPEEDMLTLKQEDGSYLLGARLSIDDINDDETLPFKLPHEEYYTTLGGLVTYQAENIPTQGQSIIIGDLTLTVEKATPRRIITMRIVQEGDLL